MAPLKNLSVVQDKVYGMIYLSLGENRPFMDIQSNTNILICYHSREKWPESCSPLKEPNHVKRR